MSSNSKPKRSARRAPPPMVHVLSVSSESGDHFGPFVFARKPSAKALEAFLREECWDEFPDDGDGPGEFGSNLYSDWQQCRVIE